MPSKKVARNDPCPCGSDRKFKNCCYGKNIDWNRPRTLPRPALPKIAPRKGTEEALRALAPYARIDAKLKEIAATATGEASWKDQVAALSPSTTLEDRIKTYQTVGKAGAISGDAAGFLIAHAVQWSPLHEIQSPSSLEENEEGGERAMDKNTVALLRRFGAADLAEFFLANRLEYNRRYERGRQFFFGPPDERLAAQLREEGIIE